MNTIVWSPVSGQFKYRYTLPGQYQSMTFPSGAKRNYTYDDQGRLTQLQNLDPSSVNLAKYVYAYDHNWTTGQDTMLGQRSSMKATVPAISWTNKQATYEYDPLYELKKVTYPNAAPFNAEVDSWTYDAIGNRLTSTVNSTTTSYTYQKIGSNPLNWQRLLNDGVNGYTYDGDGNALTMGTLTLGVDPWFDRLGSISTPASSYAYDYQGRRASKTVTGAISTYLYDGLNLIQEAGAAPADYLFGSDIDEPLAMSRGGQAYYYGVDGLGSVTLATNTSGAVQNSYVYDVWGQTRSQNGTLGNPFGYTARENGEAGTIFYRARYYQPSVGRFLAEDPKRYRSDFNLYRYVANGPVQLFDLTGLAIKQCFRAFTGPMQLLTPLILISPPIPGNTLCPMHEFLYNTDTGEFRDFDPYRSRSWETDVNVICWTIDEPLGQCVWNTIHQTGSGAGPYSLVGHNCQDAVEDAKELCEIRRCLSVGP